MGIVVHGIGVDGGEGGRLCPRVVKLCAVDYFE